MQQGQETPQAPLQEDGHTQAQELFQTQGQQGEAFQRVEVCLHPGLTSTGDCKGRFRYNCS